VTRNQYKKLVAIGIVIAVGVLAGCGGDDTPAEPAVAVSDAWARPTPPGATEGAVYLDLRATTDDALVALSVDPEVAAAAELHEMIADAAGLTSMRQLPALELPAGETVAIESGVAHVMLVDLAEPLTDGETFPLTLQFDVAPSVTVTVAVDADR